MDQKFGQSSVEMAPYLPHMMSEATGMGLEDPRCCHCMIGTLVLVVSWTSVVMHMGSFLKWLLRALVFRKIERLFFTGCLCSLHIKAEVQVLLIPRLRSPRMPLLLHFIGEKENKPSPDTKSEKICSISECKEWQALMEIKNIVGSHICRKSAMLDILCPLVSL